MDAGWSSTTSRGAELEHAAENVRAQASLVSSRRLNVNSGEDRPELDLRLCRWLFFAGDSNTRNLLPALSSFISNYSSNAQNGVVGTADLHPSGCMRRSWRTERWPPAELLSLPRRAAEGGRRNCKSQYFDQEYLYTSSAPPPPLACIAVSFRFMRRAGAIAEALSLLVPHATHARTTKAAAASALVKRPRVCSPSTYGSEAWRQCHGVKSSCCRQWASFANCSHHPRRWHDNGKRRETPLVYPQNPDMIWFAHGLWQEASTTDDARVAFDLSIGDDETNCTRRFASEIAQMAKLRRAGLTFVWATNFKIRRHVSVTNEYLNAEVRCQRRLAERHNLPIFDLWARVERGELQVDEGYHLTPESQLTLAHTLLQMRMDTLTSTRARTQLNEKHALRRQDENANMRREGLAGRVLEC